jgi:hypothetical protein
MTEQKVQVTVEEGDWPGDEQIDLSVRKGVSPFTAIDALMNCIQAAYTACDGPNNPELTVHLAAALHNLADKISRGETVITSDQGHVKFN